MNTPPAFKKKKWRLRSLIYPRFQLLIIGINGLVMLAAFTIVGLQASRTFAKLHELGVASQLNENHVYFKFVQYQAKTMYGQLAFALMGGLFISGVSTLILSHRLAGPIVRLRGYFLGISRGDNVKPLSFRKGDFFLDIPPAVNAALEKIQKKE